MDTKVSERCVGETGGNDTWITNAIHTCDNSNTGRTVDAGVKVTRDHSEELVGDGASSCNRRTTEPLDKRNDLEPHQVLVTGMGGKGNSTHNKDKKKGKEKGVPVITPDEYPEYITRLWPWPTEEAFSKAPECMKLYTTVREQCMPNYLGARTPVPSGVNCDAWDNMLAEGGDPRVGGFLRYGWPTGYAAEEIPIPTYKKHSTARDYHDDVTKFIEKEIRLGAMVGPFDSPPFAPWSQVSPILTQPKKDSKNRRVIIDLSYPEGRGVNFRNTA